MSCAPPPGRHRNHARKALKDALRPRIVTPRRPRSPKYGPKVVVALTFCRAVLGMPAGKRLAPTLGELVAVLRRFGELIIDDDTAALLVGMSAATIDRRLAGERKRHELKGRSRTKPGSLLKSQIPVRTWADWDDAVPGFVEIDLVSHDGGNAAGEHAWTLTVADIATGWTETRSVRNKARKWVLAALDDIAATMLFPILGIDSDNGSEFINHHLLTWCEQRQIEPVTNSVYVRGDLTTNRTLVQGKSPREESGECV
jgi:transposase InsO family protein